MKKGIWIRNKIIPYYLKGAKFALAMLLTEKTLSASQIATAISEKGIKCDRKELGKMLASLERMGVITLLDGIYSCNSKKQGNVNGKAFYSATPPMSVSSRGNSGV